MIRVLMRLFRLRLALLNGAAAAGGYVLSPAAAGQGTVWQLIAGVTLLAAGGSALNQLIERRQDCLMRRTSQRPLPRRDLTPTAVLAIGCGTVLAGLPILAASGGLLPPLLGIVAIAWYLWVYTPLKRHTPFALVVGAVCGAIPPVIGWTCAGGEPADYRIMILAGLLYLWQIPHFWLFQRRHADDYRRAGFPLFDPGPSGTGLCRLWLMAMAAAALLLPLFGIVSGGAARCYLVVPAGLAILAFSRSERLVRPCINLFPLLVTVTLAIQR